MRTRTTPRAPGGLELNHVHVYSVFGRFCYLCWHKKRWWAFWEKWITDDHDEPF